jgi:glycosyltransferase involved in cell wall biosynthesis
VARLRALDRYARARGGRITALETASRDSTYAWDEQASGDFARVQALPGRALADVSAREVFAAVTQSLDRLDPDAVAVNSYSGFDAQAALMWCRRRRRAAILMSDSKADDFPRSHWREAAKRRIVAQFDAALVAGSRSRAYYASLGLPESVIFEPCDVVDNDAFARPAQTDVWPDQPFFACVARLVSGKNVDGLLRAYAAYRLRVAEPWGLVLAGDGPERTRLAEQVARSRLEGVTFAGFLQYGSLPGLYQAATALVLPSFKETWGLVANEAMAAGALVGISHQSGCVPDLVEHECTGLVFDAHSEAQLADVLMRLHEMPQAERDALRQSASERVAGYTPERFAQAIWQAGQTGLRRPDRGSDPAVGLLFAGLRWTARRSEPFLER